MNEQSQSEESVACSSARQPTVTSSVQYGWLPVQTYTCLMDVPVTELRARLGHWIDVVRNGADVVITDRGTPVARMVGLDSTSIIDRLTAQGIISRPIRTARPVAGDRPRPQPKRPIADIISEQRR